MKIADIVMEEVEAMQSGRFIPYHKIALMIAVVTCIVFSVVFAHGVVFEGRIAVIDLDHSHYSAKLIEKIDSSSYIHVQDVYHSPVNANSLIMNDRNLGVLYLPKHLERDLLNNHKQINLGYMADYSNAAQNAEVIETLNEIINIESGTRGGINVAALGMTQEQTEAAINPLMIKIRRLLTPTFSATDTTVSAFIYFFSSLYIGLTTLMIMGRLRVTHQFERAVMEGPLCLIARLIPYALFYTSAITLVSCLLIVFGQMRFEGNYLFYLPTLFISAMCFGMFAMVLSWNAADPGAGAAFMILIVPPGFITGGATMAVGFLPQWAYYASHAFPLVWEYKLYRNFAFRGETLTGVLGLYGQFLLYALVLAILVTLRWHFSYKKITNPKPVPPLTA